MALFALTIDKSVCFCYTVHIEDLNYVFFGGIGYCYKRSYINSYKLGKKMTNKN